MLTLREKYQEQNRRLAIQNGHSKFAANSWHNIYDRMLARIRLRYNNLACDWLLPEQ